MAGTVLIVAALAWIGGKWDKGSSEATGSQTCASLAQTLDAVVSQGDVDKATATLTSARAACSGADFVPFEALAVRVQALESGNRACMALIGRLRATLGAGRPTDVTGMVLGATPECMRRDEVRRLVDQARQQVEAGIAAIDRGFARLEAGDADGADAALANALHANRQAAGADGLKRAIAKQRAPVPAAARPAPRDQATVVAPRDAAEEALRGLLAEGTAALAKKDYAQAKSAARSALRIAPQNATADRLLRDAEREERQALQDMDVQ